MSPDEFCRWLQGFAELHEERPTEKQWASIKKHLQAVYVKVTGPEVATKDDLAKAVRRASISGPARIC